jgi:hypothetical protein
VPNGVEYWKKTVEVAAQFTLFLHHSNTPVLHHSSNKAVVQDGFTGSLSHYLHTQTKRSRILWQNLLKKDWHPVIS